MQQDEYDKQNRAKEIVRTWITGNCSATLVIPREFAKEYGLDQPSHVLVEKKTDGLLIRKLEI